MGSEGWFPTRLAGERVVLRRHVPANLAAFRRWYSDPRVARLTRHQDGTMSPREIERFFLARVLGPDSLALAIHEREGGRLIGTCAFSQLDGDNGSALFHITIGEVDAWGRGHGTEATRLMLDHGFATLGLHRIALTVFAFNERAIRAYLRCGFVEEGRSREAIWRDGRRWDELLMGQLAHEWRERHGDPAVSGWARCAPGLAPDSAPGPMPTDAAARAMGDAPGPVPGEAPGPVPDPAPSRDPGPVADPVSGLA
jgi:RimJ/RimL family protein N-acetyltransferase